MSITHETHKPTICIDVDGVIADYSGGFKGPGVIGEPLPGARKFLDRLRAAGWKVIIFTTRGNDVMKQYMEQHDLYYDEINDNPSLRGENPGKPIAAIYLDDRGIRFNGDFDQAFEQILNFKVWYEEEPKAYGLSFGLAIEAAKKGYGFRLPQWSPEVNIRLQVPDEHSKMTAPYLYVESRFGRVPWNPTQIDILAENYEVVE